MKTMETVPHTLAQKVISAVWIKVFNDHSDKLSGFNN